MLPAFVAANDFNFDAHEINWYFHFRFRQARHAHRIFLGGNNHREIPPDAAINETAQFRFGVVVVVDVAQRKIDMGAEIFESALETFRSSDPAYRTDERAVQSV